MNPTRLTSKLEGFRNRNSANHCYVNKDIYRIFYSESCITSPTTKSNPMTELKRVVVMVLLFTGFVKNGLMNLFLP